MDRVIALGTGLETLRVRTSGTEMHKPKGLSRLNLNDYQSTKSRKCSFIHGELR